MAKGDIIDSGNIPYGEKIYLKKDSFGWKVVHPIKKDLSKPFSKENINWFNFFTGGKRNIVILILLLLFTFMWIYVYHNDTSEMQKVVSNPCSYCETRDMQKILEERLANFQNINDNLIKVDWKLPE